MLTHESYAIFFATCRPLQITQNLDISFEINYLTHSIEVFKLNDFQIRQRPCIWPEEFFNASINYNGNDL